jgi:hypothetical protein
MLLSIFATMALVIASRDVDEISAGRDGIGHSRKSSHFKRRDIAD